jgi:cation diffusion facilitator family transporter
LPSLPVSNDLASRARAGRQGVLVGIVVNICLALAKILGGWFGHSQALIADGIESSLDILSSGMTWGALKYAERPPDHDHPYGHGKMESLAAVMGSLLLIFAGLSLGLHSIMKIIYLHHSEGGGNVPATFTLVVLLATIVTKEGLFRWVCHRAKKIGSRAMEVDAQHHRSDAMTSLAAGIGISTALVGGPAWASADNWAALFSCGLIVFNGLRMLRGSVGEILDEQIAPEKMEKILMAARSVPGVTSVEKCRVRKSGLVRLADLHVRVPGGNSVHEGHRIAHAVKDRLLESEFQLADVTVHIEPG